ncbi:hypothetical protein C4K18_0137 [Pseudomonas chlororaphis subsp. aurantiaca]|nr:hypothetical protein C4K18_0137 [Pseudomonas chlororaphis subsp. aurantiaca]
MREPIPVMPSSRWAPCVGLQIDVCGQACVPLTSLFSRRQQEWAQIDG